MPKAAGGSSRCGSGCGASSPATAGAEGGFVLPGQGAGSGSTLCSPRAPGSWPWPGDGSELRARCLQPSPCRRWPSRERTSPAQSCCPARLQKLELQIHNSSGTPWLFVSCCEQMEELQIKPSAAREPTAFPTQPRRQQQRQGGGKGKGGGK